MKGDGSFYQTPQCLFVLSSPSGNGLKPILLKFVLYQDWLAIFLLEGVFIHYCWTIISDKHSES